MDGLDGRQGASGDGSWQVESYMPATSRQRFSPLATIVFILCFSALCWFLVAEVATRLIQSGAS